MLKQSLLCLFSCFQIAAFSQNALDQPVDFITKNQAITGALFALSETVDVNITFSPKLFSKNKKVSITAYKEPLRKILNRFLADTDIDFKLSDGGIILFKKPIPYFIINGYLTDAKTGERLVGANVFELTNLVGGASNAYGFYSQKFKRGTLCLQVSYLGYQTKVIEVNLDKPQQLNIALEPSLTLKEIVVTSQKDSAILLQNGSEITLPLEWLSHLPAAAGEPDLLRYIQLMPGVQSGGDGFGGLHVRGGNSDQNLILLDDVPVYNPSHTFGLFSIFNPDLAKSVKFYKSGFPARYDSRISSVLDVRTREGNTENFTAELSLGTMASRAVAEIPINRGRGGILIAGRRSHINLWLKPLTATQKSNNDLEGEMSYTFSDLNIKGHYSFSEKDKVYLSYYTGGDQFADTSISFDTTINIDQPGVIDFSSFQTYNLDWGNQILSARWNRLHSEKLFSNTTATYSNFQYTSIREEEAEFSILDEDYFAFRERTSYSSVISDVSLRTDFDYFTNQEHHVRFGAAAIHRRFQPGLTETNLEGSELDSIPEIEENNFDENEAIKTLEFSLYLEDEFQRGNWTINGGLRFAVFSRKNKVDVVPQPRLAINYHFNQYLNFQASTSHTTQFLHLLTRSDSGLPNDLWLPSDLQTPPQKAWQFSSSLSGSLNHGRHWKVEGYYKKMDNLFRIDKNRFEDAVSIDMLEIDVNNWEDFVEKGTGKSYGVEISLEQQKGRLTGWVGYAFSKTFRTFQGIEQPYSFDSRHGVTIATTLQITDKLDLSLNWLWQSGRPVSTSDYGEQDVPFTSLLNTATTSQLGNRLPTYHRLDAGLNFHFSQKKWQHKIKLGVYNAYNQKNVFFAYDSAVLSNGKTTSNVVYGLPILPSLSYSLRW